jgi:hypothetical protein
MSKRIIKRLNKRLSKRNKKNNKSRRRNKTMKGGTGFRAPQGVNFVPFSKSSYSFIQDVPLDRALGAASR